MPSDTYDPSLKAEQNKIPLLGFDLTGFGVFPQVNDPEVDLPSQKVDLVRLSVVTRGCFEVGASLVAFGSQFRRRSVKGGTDLESDDAVEIISHLVSHIPAAGLAAGVHTSSLANLTKAYNSLANSIPMAGAWSAIHVDGLIGDSLQFVLQSLHNLRQTQIGKSNQPRVLVTLRSATDIELVAKYADYVRLRSSNPQVPQVLRQRLQEAAKKAGRALIPKILVDARICIVANPQTIEAREFLSSALEGEQAYWLGATLIAGSVEEVYESCQNWLTVADGIMLIPMSVEGDLAPIVKQLLPALLQGNLPIRRPGVDGITMQIDSIAGAI